MRDPGRYYDININGTRTLLDAMIRAGIAAIVFSSSCAVYGVHGHDAITERDAANPVNPYGFSKLACERMLRDYGAAHGLRAICLRYFNAAGADPGAQIGEHHNPETHLIPLVLDAAAGRRSAVTVYGADYETRDGTAVRDYVHVADLADAHVSAAQRILAGADPAVFNLGTGTGASVREVIDAAQRVTGRRISSTDAARRPGDPPMLVASAELARRALGWAPQRSDLETILRDAWTWSEKRFGAPHPSRARAGS
jgi:UDP-glucose 4-epimerase